MERPSIYIYLILGVILSVTFVGNAKPDDVLTNGDFDGGITSWTSSAAGGTVGYDSSYYGTGDPDGEGSLKGETNVGAKVVLTGDATQTITTYNINSDDTVELSLKWSKRMVVSTAAAGNTIIAQIAKPSAPTTWVDIWTDISFPSANGPTAWTGPISQDVSSYFTETGQYKFRLYFNLTSGNNASAQALAWIDSASLDVLTIKPVITDLSGSQNVGKMVTLSYTGTHPDNLPCTYVVADCDYSLDSTNGSDGSWYEMSRHSSDTGSEAFTSAGASLSFVWDAAANSNNTEDVTVWARLKVTDGTTESDQVTIASAFALDTLDPTLDSVAVAGDNSSATVTFSEGAYANSNGTGDLIDGDFTVSLSGGTATLTESSVSHTAGAATAVITLTLSGTPDGNEVLTVEPFDGASVYDAAGNAMLATESQTDNLNSQESSVFLIEGVNIEGINLE